MSVENYVLSGRQGQLHAAVLALRYLRSLVGRSLTLTTRFPAARISSSLRRIENVANGSVTAPFWRLAELVDQPEAVIPLFSESSWSFGFTSH